MHPDTHGTLIIIYWILKKKIEYLIDIHDITDNADDDEYLFFGTLLKLEDIDKILGFVWKQKEH